MITKKVVEWLDNIKTCYSGYEAEEALKTAIVAVNKFEEYKEIGTVEQCREAVEKRLAITPNFTKNVYRCPQCGAARSMKQKHNYCHDCGQALDWN